MGKNAEKHGLFGKKNLWIWLVMALYTFLLAITIVRHEPWGDEAQAWLLARDAGLMDLFVKYLRYEGSPGLWHLILMLPAKLHLPYITLQIIAGLFAWFGVLVFMLYAPFPRYVKALFPFGYFILYQYAAIARVYTVFPLVLFLIAIVYKDRMSKPFVFMGLLCLLSLLSIHGLVISLGILLAHLVEAAAQWRNLGQIQRKKQLLSGTVFLLLLLSIHWILKVPGDYFNAGSSLIRMNPMEIFRLSFLALSDTLLTNILFKVGITTKDFILLFVSLFSWYALAKFAWMRRRFLVFLLSMGALFGLLFGVNYFSPWHTGLIYILWIFILWISADNTLAVPEAAEPEETAKIGKTVYIMLAIACIVQITWSISALTFDWTKSYSGALGVAKYIKANKLENKKIFTNFPRSMAINGYFDHEIFVNLHHPHRAFVVWTKKEFLKAITLNEIVGEQPELIVVKGYNIYGNYTTPDLLNYKFDGIYNGGLFWKDRLYLPDTYLVFKRKWIMTNQKFTYQECETAVNLLNLNSESKDLLRENQGPIIGSY